MLGRLRCVQIFLKCCVGLSIYLIYLINYRPVTGYSTKNVLHYCCIMVTHVWSHMYGHTYIQSMDQASKVASPARGQLNRKNEYFPVSVVRA